MASTISSYQYTQGTLIGQASTRIGQEKKIVAMSKKNMIIGGDDFGIIDPQYVSPFIQSLDAIGEKLGMTLKGFKVGDYIFSINKGADASFLMMGTVYNEMDLDDLNEKVKHDREKFWQWDDMEINPDWVPAVIEKVRQVRKKVSTYQRKTITVNTKNPESLEYSFNAAMKQLVDCCSLVENKDYGAIVQYKDGGRYLLNIKEV